MVKVLLSFDVFLVVKSQKSASHNGKRSCTEQRFQCIQQCLRRYPMLEKASQAVTYLPKSLLFEISVGLRDEHKTLADLPSRTRRCG